MLNEVKHLFQLETGTEFFKLRLKFQKTAFFESKAQALCNSVPQIYFIFL